MNKVLIILKHEFSSTLRKKSFILATLALPIIAILTYGIYNLVQERTDDTVPTQVVIGCVDEAGVVTGHWDQGQVTFISYPGEEPAKAALLQSEIQEYMVITADYLDTGRILRYTTANEVEISGGVVSAMTDFLRANLAGSSLDADLLERVQHPLALSSFHLDEKGEVSPAKDEVSAYLVPLIFGMLFYIALFMTSGLLFQSVTEEKENRVIEIVLSSVTPGQLLAGKLVGLGAAGLLQIGVWLATLRLFSQVAAVNIPFLSGVTVPTGLLLWAMLYFVLGYFLFAAIYAGVGSVSTSAKEGQSLSTIFILPAILPMMLNPYLITHPDSLVSRLLCLFPMTAPIAIMFRLPNGSMAAWEIGLSIVLLIVSAVLITWVAAKVFRTYLLMYGKRPAFREILSLMRSK